MTQPANKRLVTEATVDALAADKINDETSDTRTALNATYVTYVDSVTGLPLVDKHVIIKVDQSGLVPEIADIVVEDI